MNKGNAFNTFSEAPITFRPTYKFDVNTKSYASIDTPFNFEITSEYTKSSLNTSSYNIKPSATLTTSPNIDIFDSSSINNSEMNETKPLKNEHIKENIPPNHGINDTTLLSKPMELKNVYDTSKKARIPSWTDRILFRVRHQKPINSVILESNSSNNNNNPLQKTQYNNMNSIRIPLKPVLVEKYTSCENMHWSDHKPVIGSFRIENDWSCDDAVNNKVVHRKTNKNACIIQ